MVIFHSYVKLPEGITGWWYTYPSEKYDFVSWDYILFPIYGKIKFMFQTTNQIIIIKQLLMIMVS